MFLSPCQLTMEKLCRLKPLHPGLSPAVLRDLQWSEISEAAYCQCWRTLLTELKPGHRAMLYNAMQEVMVLLSVFNTSHITFLIFSSSLIICCGSPCGHMRSRLTQLDAGGCWQLIQFNIIILCYSYSCTRSWKLTAKCLIKTENGGLSDINLANLALGFPDSVHLIHMCETGFVFSKWPLNETLGSNLHHSCSCCMSTGSTQRPAEHHSAVQLSVAVCPFEEADRNLKWRSNPERYQPAQRHTLVTTAGAHLTLTYLCVLFKAALIWQQ